MLYQRLCHGNKKLTFSHIYSFFGNKCFPDGALEVQKFIFLKSVQNLTQIIGLDKVIL